MFLSELNLLELNMRFFVMVLFLFAETVVANDTVYGRASFYGDKWIGRLTANGERYKPNDVTAAHKSLPFNTNVRVTNLKNGKSVVVRINNRGPYIRGRDLDLSVVAAKTLDMVSSGVIPVKMEIVRSKKSPVTNNRVNGRIKYRYGNVTLAALPCKVPQFRLSPISLIDINPSALGLEIMPMWAVKFLRRPNASYLNVWCEFVSMACFK